jgi:hypothetical protein
MKKVLNVLSLLSRTENATRLGVISFPELVQYDETPDGDDDDAQIYSCLADTLEREMNQSVPG